MTYKEEKAYQILNLSGLICPQPIIQTKLRFSKLAPGERLLVIVTDHSYAIDCGVFVKKNGHKIVEINQSDDKHIYLLEKGSEC